MLPDGQRIPLCRLRYGGSAHSFGFAIYSAASDRYQDAVLRTGVPTGTPQEALDTACTVHEQAETTQIYLHADLALKERALARTTPAAAKPGRYTPPDKLLAFLEAL